MIIDIMDEIYRYTEFVTCMCARASDRDRHVREYVKAVVESHVERSYFFCRFLTYTESTYLEPIRLSTRSPPLPSARANFPQSHPNPWSVCTFPRSEVDETFV